MHTSFKQETYVTMLHDLCEHANQTFKISNQRVLKPIYLFQPTFALKRERNVSRMTSGVLKSFSILSDENKGSHNPIYAYTTNANILSTSSVCRVNKIPSQVIVAI